MDPAIPNIFDRALYLARQKKASAAQSPLLAHVADDLAERLSVINHQFENVLVIASQPGPFVQTLQMTGKCGSIEARVPAADDDLGLPPLTYNAVFTLLDMHCVNDVPGYLAQCARSLKPDGLFFSSCFADETLAELRQSWLVAESETREGVSPRVAPMIGVREMGGLLQRAGLALPVTDSDRLTLRYKDALALLREVKAFGFANPLHDRRKTFTSQAVLAAALADYQSSNADPDGRVRASLDLLWAMAWKPHESQPQPKKPGSATARMVDFLKPGDYEN
ncbi:SAM-dependent methyltransferase [Aestuariivirga litoralis]|uniref:SAM-dependent methyltransferase n=1 Tax=Aestuariivirga litoralis TaxID=2650924 RepID=UPI0018C5FEF6|nr:SAM-dependent methyltransferase [Aestuariivirga litoralis]MBG1233550.1 SAM-dependent methyltransferase [Aestuariivirga litoralis]